MFVRLFALLVYRATFGQGIPHSSFLSPTSLQLTQEWRVGRTVVNGPFVGMIWRCRCGGWEYIRLGNTRGTAAPREVLRSRTKFVPSSSRLSFYAIKNFGRNIRESKGGVPKKSRRQNLRKTVNLNTGVDEHRRHSNPGTVKPVKSTLEGGRQQSAVSIDPSSSREPFLRGLLGSRYFLYARLGHYYS
jgi:hypothetical protein